MPQMAGHFVARSCPLAVCVDLACAAKAIACARVRAAIAICIHRFCVHIASDGGQARAGFSRFHERPRRALTPVNASVHVTVDGFGGR